MNKSAIHETCETDECLQERNRLSSENNKMLPVVMLAHNEEQVIERSIDSILQQRLPAGVTMRIFVFSNGCTDRTEEIIAEYSLRDSRVEGISLQTKGKVAAVKQSVSFLEERSAEKNSTDQNQHQLLFDQVVYVDADIELTHPKTLWHLSEKLNSSPDLYLVSTFPLLNVAKQTGWFLKSMFKAREFLQLQVRYNVVRGPCYIIDFDILKRIDYPDGVVIDDMYLEVRLSGHTLMDFEHPVLHHQRSTLKAEIDRDLFTLLARDQIYKVKRQGLIKSLDKETARPEWSLSWFSAKECLYQFIRKRKFVSLGFAGIWFLIHRYNQYRAAKIMRKNKLSGSEILGLWSTER